ncbi:RNase adapter RapZ [Nakamurella flava]|uniref:RNase adapter RapZ n=1 Tax=Nakamurella flava TaxID=2576308 RepID=A0A4U6QKG1_9ACTN|nr:RNase adapter RapZ [Nakamurella flava]TKV60811.1 RNase adapter RapZ [Nakamurella flava]
MTEEQHGQPSSDARTSPSATPTATGAIEVAIVSGLSGAGRSTAAKVLEDMGWFVVDNLPPELISRMVDLGSRTSGDVTRIAIVLDVRTRAFTEDLASVIKDLDTRGYRPRVLYLEADDAILIRRFESNRRSHPLQGGGRLADGITRERMLLEPLRQEADVVVDTSKISVHQLRNQIERAFGQDAPDRHASLTVVSFGFKYGLPLDADMVVDMRFLPNPHWIPELREHTGRDQDVSDYVLSQDGISEFLDRYVELLGLVNGGYRREGKRYLTLAVGCTGGKHRSVAVAEEFARRLADESLAVTVVHRDLGRE